MNKRMLSMIKCPECGGLSFSVDEFKNGGDEIIDGRLTCNSCDAWYRIENGILDLLPFSLRRQELHHDFARRYELEAKKAGAVEDEQKDGQMKFFAKFSRTYDKEVADSPYFSTFDRVVFGGWIKKNISPGQYILDVGCGSGVQSVVIGKEGINVVGVDISEEMLLVAKRKVDESGIANYVDLIVGDAENIPLRDNIFDAYFMVGTLHHVKAPQMVVKSATDKIKNGGAVFTSDNHKSHVRFLSDILMRMWKLYDEEARDEPLFVARQFYDWYGSAGVKSSVRISTYLPPHLYFFLSKGAGESLLKITNAVFGAIPYIKNFGGIIVLEGKKA